MSDLTAEVRAALTAASPAPWKACTEEWSLADAGDIPVVDAMGDYLCCSPEDGVRGGHSEADAALIAAAPSWLAALCDRLDAAEESERQFAAALGYGDGVTEPVATLAEMLDPIKAAFADATDHGDCPTVCELCGERLAATRCERCHGSGCLPNAGLAYLECESCAGVGKVHADCVEQSYAELTARAEAAEAKLAAAKAALSTHTTEAHGCTCTECQIARILNGDPNA